MKKFYFLLLFVCFSFLGFGQIISQYVETNSGTTPKGIEIWNNTSGTLDFTANNLVIKKGSNGGAPSDDFTLSSTTLAAGNVIVIGTSDMEVTTTGNGAVFHLKAFTFNGDDALEVWYGGTKTDVFGTPNSDPGSSWDGNGVSTKNQNISLLAGITTGDTDGWTDPSLRFETTSTTPATLPAGIIGFGLAPSSGSSPTISLSESALTGFSYEVGSGPSAEQSFTASGTDLSADISIDAPTNYEISTETGIDFAATDPIVLTQTGGDVSATTIYVRLKAGLAIADYNGENITATSTDATNKLVVCSGSVTGPAPDLCISEIMQNPSSVADGNGEYFEIYNYGSTTVDINGFIIKDDGSDSHTINNGGALNIAAGEFLVMGIDGNTGTNGGVTVDYEYSSFTLSNGDDEVILMEGTTEIDRVEYDGGSVWPDPTGTSMAYIGTTAENNNNGANWIESFVRENGFDNSGSDLGSPGTNGLYQNLVTSTTWTGTGNWSEGNSPGASNWSNGSPGSAVDVIIDGSVTVDMVSTMPALCSDLTINNSRTVTISIDNALTINGFYSNGAGTLTVKSTASGDGSLIVEGGVGGAVVVERYIGGHGGIDDAGWHLFGSPVSSSFNVATSDFAPGATDDLYYWDELNYLWKNYKAAPFSFTGGEGYLFAYESNSTKHFDAYINNQSFPKTGLTNTGGTADDGWHLLGNPYPSAIKWNDGNWGLSNIVATAQVYNEVGGNYLPVAANGYIQSTQGFFVQVSAGFTGSLTIPLASREHNDVAWYKSTDSEENALELKISGGSNSFYDITKVSFNDAANNEFNAEFDSHKLYGRPSAPQLYTIQGEETMSINTLQPQEEELIVPMEFFTRTDGEFTIEVQSNTVNTVGNIYLEDKVNDQMINLSTQSAYTFNASASDDASRFLLHFNGVTDVEELEEAQGPVVYALENYVYISSLENMDAQVMIYNTNGQLVGQDRMNNEQLKRIAVKASPGIYLVNIQSEDAVYTEKVYIK